jgi:hypothetical protein
VARQWLAQIGPAATLAGFGYLFHGLIGVVYQRFYAKLGVSAAEIGHDSASGMGTLVALDGLTVIFVIALLLPVVSGVLAVHGLHRNPTTSRTVVLACMAPAVLVAVAHAPDNPLTRQMIAFAAVSAAIGIALGFAMSTLAPVTVFLPLATVLVSAVAVKVLITVLHGQVAFTVAMAFLALLALGVFQVQRRLTQTGRPLTQAFGVRWPTSAVRQSAITFAGVALVALGGVADLYHLDAAAGRAADQSAPTVTSPTAPTTWTLRSARSPSGCSRRRTRWACAPRPIRWR